MTDVYARGKCHSVAASYTRPGDTTPYNAGDVICNSTSAPAALQFAAASLDPLVRAGVIAHATLVCGANQATKLDAELWLFTAAPAMDNDNAAFTPTDAELDNLAGIISLTASAAKVGDATAGAAGNCVIEAPNLALPFQCAAGSTALFGVLVARNVYTPVASETFRVALRILD